MGVARRKAIYETLYPETAAGVSQASGMRGACGRQLGDHKTADRFTAETSTKTGKSERSVQRDATRGERIDPEVMTDIRGTP